MQRKKIHRILQRRQLKLFSPKTNLSMQMLSTAASSPIARERLTNQPRDVYVVFLPQADMVTTTMGVCLHACPDLSLPRAAGRRPRMRQPSLRGTAARERHTWEKKKSRIAFVICSEPTINNHINAPGQLGYISRRMSRDPLYSAPQPELQPDARHLSSLRICRSSCMSVGSRFRPKSQRDEHS